MKIRFISAILVIATLLAFDVRGQQQNGLGGPTNSLNFGSVSKVNDYAASVATAFWMDVYQINPDRTLLYFDSVTDNHCFTNKQEVDNWFHARVNQSCPKILASTAGNRGSNYIISAIFLNVRWGYGLLGCYQPFMLVHTNDQYYLPDMSGYQLSLYTRIPYQMPGIKWSILEVNGFVTPVFDSRVDPDYWANGGVDYGYNGYVNDLLILKTVHILGDYDLKLMTVSGNDNAFRIFNKNGVLVPETPVVVGKPMTKNGNCSIKVTGGDPGRHLVLQGSTNLVNWSDLRPEYVVYYSGYDPGFTYSETSNYPKRFFRVKAINSPN